MIACRSMYTFMPMASGIHVTHLVVTLWVCSSVSDYELALALEGQGGCGAPETAETESDLLLAQMLQLQFDREHDAMLEAEERKKNANSKGELCPRRHMTQKHQADSLQ